MALDEALLEACRALEQPVLRFYGWTEPAATFGYFQKYSDVERATFCARSCGVPPAAVSCRMTRTGLTVLRFLLPTNGMAERGRELPSHARMDAGGLCGIEGRNRTRACCRKSEPGQCFVGHEKFDLLWQGKKIAGAAQRRNKLGLLIQGSVQPPPLGLQRSDWEDAMQRAGAKMFGAEWAETKPDEALSARVAELVREKYSQQSYNKKR